MAKNVRPFESETIYVADAPKKFDLVKSLREAEEIWIVTAFARQSGWRIIREAVRESKASINLICGLSFCQSEPDVMRDWLRLGTNAKSFIYIGNKIFHPKVFLIRGKKTQYALIGSGNLTEGGLHGNFECFSYLDKPEAIRQITIWLEKIVQDRETCVRLTRSEIASYEKKWKRAADARKKLDKLAKDSAADIKNARTAHIENWNKAVKEAKAFFKTQEFSHWHKDHKAQAKKILRLLNHPLYDFDYEQWVQFYEIKNMGHLLAFFRDRVFKQRKRLQKSLCILADSSRPIDERVDAILSPSSPTYIKYLGRNAATKILASIDPQTWPVLNNPVERALASFGYKNPWGASSGEKYAALSDLMAEFKMATGAPDMLALDCFFYFKDQANIEK